MGDAVFEQRVDWMARGGEFFAAALDRVPDDGLAAPSLLTGWSRAHVVAHVARNADALHNLLEWARTGVERQMYSGPDQRERDITAGAGMPPRELRADYAAADGRFTTALRELPGECWAAKVRSARGREIPAAEVPWMRAREVWVHAVDLRSGARLEDLDPGLVRALVDDAMFWVGRSPDCPPVDLVPDDGAPGWRLGPRDVPAQVTARGAAAALLGWVIGRSDGAALRADGPLPRLPRWL